MRRKRIIALVVSASFFIWLAAPAFAVSLEDEELGVNTLGGRLEQLEKELEQLGEEFAWAETELGAEKVEYLRLQLADIKKDIELSKGDRIELVALIREARVAIEQATTREEKREVERRYYPEIERRKARLEAEYRDIKNRLEQLKWEKERLLRDIRQIRTEREKRKRAEEIAAELAKPRPPIWQRGKFSLEVASMTTEEFSTTTIGLRGRRWLFSEMDIVIRVDGVVKDETQEKEIFAFFPALEWRGLGFGNLRLMPGIETGSINWKVYPSFGVLWEDEYSPQQTMKTHSVGYYLMFQWLFSDNAYRAAFGMTW